MEQRTGRRQFTRIAKTVQEDVHARPKRVLQQSQIL